MMTNQKPKAYSYIRFSTPEQAEGDSERRQIEIAESYATDKGLTLEPLRDMGVSGHSGKHISKGELGKFLNKIEKGEITPNSRLIIESIDRLTRLKPSDAQTLLLNILEAQITLVVLDYGAREITLEKYNNEPGIFYQLMGELQRAYQESKRKSELLSNTWKHKRKKARNGQKLTGMCPKWLKLSEDKQSFIVKQEVVEVINMMFQMKLNGKGAAKIVRELNDMDGIFKPPKNDRNKTGGWRKSTVNRYLRDRKVLGEFQPHKIVQEYSEQVDRKVRRRKPKGDPILDYYPQIVDTETFNKVQAVIAANRNKKGNAGGKTGTVSNLFQHLVKCGACGSPMAYQNKGKWQYLRCDVNRRNLDCGENRTVRYDSVFEPLLLHYCRGLDVSDILPGDEQRRSKLATLQNQLQAVNGRLSTIADKKENVLQSIDHATSGKAIETLTNRLEEYEEEETDAEAQKSELLQQIETLNNTSDNTEQRLRDIQELINRLGDLEGEERKDLRLSIRSKLKRLIDRIDIQFGTFTHNDREYISFKIQFKDGVTRTLILEEGELSTVTDQEKDRQLIYWVQDGAVDVHSNYDPEKQKEANKIVAQALQHS